MKLYCKFFFVLSLFLLLYPMTASASDSNHTEGNTVAALSEITDYAETTTGPALIQSPDVDSAGGLDYPITETPAAMGLSQTELELTIGFSKTLSVTSSSGPVAWNSDNQKIASVDSTGKVTAKKIGSCIITATCGEEAFHCNVTVTKNIYHEERITLAHVNKGSTCVQVYKAYYDKKGNIKVILAVANNNDHKIEALKKLKISFKTPTRKKIASFTLKDKKLTVKKKQIKNVTFLIPKKNVSIKKADLRNAFSSVSGKYSYTKTTYFHKKNE